MIIFDILKSILGGSNNIDINSEINNKSGNLNNNSFTGNTINVENITVNQNSKPTSDTAAESDDEIYYLRYFLIFIGSLFLTLMSYNSTFATLRFWGLFYLLFLIVMFLFAKKHLAVYMKYNRLYKRMIYISFFTAFIGIVLVNVITIPAYNINLAILKYAKFVGSILLLFVPNISLYGTPTHYSSSPKKKNNVLLFIIGYIFLTTLGFIIAFDCLDQFFEFLYSLNAPA